MSITTECVTCGNTAEIVEETKLDGNHTRRIIMCWNCGNEYTEIINPRYRCRQCDCAISGTIYNQFSALCVSCYADMRVNEGDR